MLVGINYPWIDYGWDFGDPPAAWVDPQNVSAWRERKREKIVADFAKFARLGLFAVRWFILADGLSYGVGDEAPQRSQKDSGEDSFDPLPRDHPFHRQLCDDFEFVLQTCSEFKLKFLPSLIDFHWCHRATVVDEKTKIVKGGRRDILIDKAKRIKFFDNVFEPLLEISLRHHEAIYAWELINEPEWLIKKTSWFKIGRAGNRTVPLPEMLKFIAAGAARINDKRLPDGQQAFQSTVGFAHWDAIEDWDSAGLGITLDQFHYYAPDQRLIPTCEYSERSPRFIGEFAGTFHRGWPDLDKQEVAHTIAARLKCLGGKKYSAAFIWSARASDDATVWTDEVEEDIAGFFDHLKNDRA